MNQGIEYNITLEKVKRTLERLKTIGLDVSKHEELVDVITKETKENVKYNIEIDKESETEEYMPAFLEATYLSAIKRLNRIYQDLSNYEVYFKVASITEVLRNFIESPVKDLSKLEKLRNSLYSLLNKHILSKTLDYDVLKGLIEDVYHLTYLFIKEEIRLIGSSPTINILEDVDTHRSYLDREILKDVEKIDLRKDEFRAIAIKKGEIETKGFGVTYLNEDFLRLIVVASTPLEYYKSTIEELTRKVSLYYTELDDARKKLESLDSDKESNKMDIKASYKEIVQNATLFATSLGIIVGLVAGSCSLAKKISTDKKYYTETTTYSSLTGEEVTTSEYKLHASEYDGTTIYKYQPYEYIGGEVYSRAVTKYYISHLDEMALSEYLSLNLESLGIIGKQYIEEITSLNLSDLYETAYWEVEKIVSDEEDYIEDVNGFTFVICLIVFLVVSGVIDLIIEGGVLEKIFKTRSKCWGFYYALTKIREKIEEIKQSKKSIAEKEKELKDVVLDIAKLFKDNQEVLKEIEKIIPYLENKGMVEEAKEARGALSRVRELEKTTIK